MKNSVYDCVILPLSKIHNRAGNITIVEGKRIFPLMCDAFIIFMTFPAVKTGAATPIKSFISSLLPPAAHSMYYLTTGRTKKIVTLNRPDYGVMVVPGIWRELFEFSSGAICLVLASQKYDQDDYLRSYEQFVNFRG